MEGFLKSWGVILASEIGDKTFFIAAVMAMRNSRKLVSEDRRAIHNVLVPVGSRADQSFASFPPQVFIGAIGALAAMTVLSALLGWAAPNLVSYMP